MEIRRDTIERMTLSDFADRYGLVLHVSEQPKRFRDFAFSARFRRVEVRDGFLLRSQSGRGETESEAIADYARQISGHPLVIDAGRASRRNVDPVYFIAPR